MWGMKWIDGSLGGWVVIVIFVSFSPLGKATGQNTQKDAHPKHNR